MKTNFKRLFALVLTLCMLASLMVPVAFAEDVAVAAPSTDVVETYPIRLKDINHTDPATATGLDKLMVKFSSTSQQYQYNGFTMAKLADAYANGEVNWNYLAHTKEWTYRVDGAYQSRLSNRAWAAVQIRVENGGLYALNLTTDKVLDTETEVTPWTNESVAFAGKIAAYIIPAAVANDAIANAVATETETAAQVAIPTLMTDEYSVGTVAMAASEDTITFARTRMEAGEYVVVYHNTTGANYYLSEMTLTGETYQMENVATYNLRPFDMSNYDVTTYAGTINEKMLVEGAFTDRVTSSSVIAAAGLNYSYFSAVGSSYYRASGAWQLDAKNGAVGLVIDVAESGELYFSLKTDKTNYKGTDTPWSNGYTNFAGDMKLWLIPYDVAVAGGTASSAKKASLTTLTADDTYSLGVKHMMASEETVTFDKAYVEAGKYVVAFMALGAQSAWCEMSIAKVAGQELPESEKLSGTVATYDFEIYNNERYAPIFTKEDGSIGSRGWGNGAFTGLEGVYEATTEVDDIIAKDYAAGIINYKLETLGNIDASTFEASHANPENYGLRIQKDTTTEAENRYLALRINVPATALYNGTLNVHYNSVDKLNIYIYDADAEGTVAENMTEANLAGTFFGGKTLTFAHAITAGENIIVFEIADTTAKDTLRLLSIDLKVSENESVTYNFDLTASEVYRAKLEELSGGKITTVPTGGTVNLEDHRYTNDEGKEVRLNGYKILADLFATGKINWALDGHNSVLSNIQIYSSSTRYRLRTVDNGFAGMRIRVDNAGTYNLTIKASATANPYAVYLIPATNIYSDYNHRILTEEMLAANTPLATSATESASVNFTYTFNQSGEYILAFAETGVSNNDIYIRSLVMDPVANSVTADGIGYASLEEALAKATDYVFLNENAQVKDITLPAGVTLDLNGHILYASSVDASAPGAQIIDSMDGKSLLRGEIEFNEANAQLPLYDIDANGYKLFNVDVESCATTGYASSTKYWFKVKFSNANAYDMIGINSELRINAQMAATYKENQGDNAGLPYEGTATADVAFNQKWVANKDGYIVVYVDGTGAFVNFQLTPAVSANGVIIGGDYMVKNT